MNPNRLLLVLLLLLVVAAAAFWALAERELPAAGPGPVPDQKGEAAAAVAAPAPAVSIAAANAAKPVRIEVAPSEGGGSGPGLLGQVVDENGQPVAAALVDCVPGAGFTPDFDSIDFAELAEDFDPMAVMQQAKEQLQQLVEVKTDADGRFRVVPSGVTNTVGLRIRAPGHLVLDKTARRPSRTDTDLGVLALQRAAIVRGRVVDGQGNPIAGATVARPNGVEARMLGDLDIELAEAEAIESLRSGDLAVTDAAGRFELLHVEPGEFALRARHKDHPTARRDGLTVKAGQTLADVLITVEPGAAICGHITGAPADVHGLRVLAAATPVTGAEPAGFLAAFADPSELFADAGFGFGERSVDVGADAVFALRGLRLGRTYRIWAVQTGSGLSDNAVCSRRLEVAAPRIDVELPFDPGITVTFRVVDARNKAAVERLWVGHQLRGGNDFAAMMVMASGAGARARHYPGGRASVANLRPRRQQTLDLKVEAIGFLPLQREAIALPAAGNLDLGTLLLEPSPVVHVTVLDAGNGRPVTGAAVRLQLPGATAADNPLLQLAEAGRATAGASAGKTDGDGRCTLNVPAGAAAAVVRVSSKLHAPYLSAPIPTLQPEVDHEVLLLRGGAVAVQVQDADGAPIQDAVVEHQPADQRKTDAHGLVRFERLQPGEHRFRIGTSGNTMMAAVMASARGVQAAAATGWQTVLVSDGATAAILLQKEPTACLRGVVRENGAPLAGARIQFLDGKGGGEPEQMAAQMMTEMMGQMGGGGGAHTARCGDDGSYRLADLPTGEHRLRITHARRAMPATVAVTLRKGEAQFDIELDAALLRGTVRDPQGNPVAGATVRALAAPTDAEGSPEQAAIRAAMASILPGVNLGGGNTAKTDADGSYELRGVDTGVQLVVHASAKGFAAAASAPVEVDRGGTRLGVDIALGQAGSIKITVADAGQFAAVNATYAGEQQGVAPVMQILQKGKGTLEGLLPGPWKVELHDMGAGDKPREPRTVEVKAGETAVVEF